MVAGLRRWPASLACIAGLHRWLQRVVASVHNHSGPHTPVSGGTFGQTTLLASREGRWSAAGISLMSAAPLRAPDDILKRFLHFMTFGRRALT